MKQITEWEKLEKIVAELSKEIKALQLRVIFLEKENGQAQTIKPASCN